MHIKLIAAARKNCTHLLASLLPSYLSSSQPKASQCTGSSPGHWPHFNSRETKARKRQGSALTGHWDPCALVIGRVFGHRTKTLRMAPSPGSPCGPAQPSGSPGHWNILHEERSDGRHHASRLAEIGFNPKAAFLAMLFEV